MNINYLGDELVHKIKVLTLALSEAKNIITILEQENVYLANLLANIEAENKKDSSNEMVYA
jgi:hypothetical protein